MSETLTCHDLSPVHAAVAASRKVSFMGSGSDAAPACCPVASSLCRTFMDSGTDAPLPAFLVACVDSRSWWWQQPSSSVSER